AQDGGNIGIFVFVGYAPATDMIKDKIVLNEQGYVVTDQNQRTNIEGVYAAGDVCIKNLRQVVTAVSDGAVAATSLEKYISETRERLKLGKPQQTAAPAKEVVADAQDALAASDNTAKDGFLSKEMRGQLSEVFEKFSHTVIIKAVIGQDAVSAELESFVNELVGIHDKVKSEIDDKTLQTGDAKPYIDICNEQGSIGVRYYSVPGGHEFNSFVVALYNASGAGQSVGENTQQRIREITQKHLLQVMATLSCTNCPEVVMATQKIATLSETIEAEMYDLSKFPEFKEKYSIMAVPCLVIDDGKEVLFGKKGVEEIVGILEKMQD
ncbi:MAG: thioredoxin family protein, partial [Lachnospiraceae bacterium]|nr:thioredoxin family protein [Lachnospiraceae bacterium]